MRMNALKGYGLVVTMVFSGFLQANDSSGVQYLEPVTPYVFNGDIRTMNRMPQWQPGDPIKEIPKQRKQPTVAVGGETRQHLDDPVLQSPEDALKAPSDRSFSTPDLSQNGQGFSGVNPPDTVGDVGKDYYIQVINTGAGSSFTVYNKSNGTVAAGPTTLDTLGSGVCANGAGDPIVVYDELAERWLLSEFSTQADKTLCVYISQTSNPITGGWFNYAFVQPSFPDYPKYGVWPDGYYVSANENPSVYVMQRAEMLNGAAAALQRVAHAGLAGFGFQAMTPADLDGADSPPANSPGYFMRHRDDEAHNVGSNNAAEDYLEIWEYSVDWITPGNSTFTKVQDLAVAEFDSNLCGLTSFSCFTQQDSATKLDPLREVVMWRLQYRNFGTHESLVGNLTTDVAANDQGGIRWFELRKTGNADWSVFQQGTYAPDSGNRWMGSIAMDGSGNIAVAYNVADANTYPGLRYAGRLKDDTLGVLTQGENTLIAGSAANASNRYGDYSAMSVDPVDDCTFWFTGQYNPSSQWSTRISKFKFDGCTGVIGSEFSLSSSSQLSPAVCADSNFNLVASLAGGGGANVVLAYDSLPSGFSNVFTPAANLVPPGDITSTVTLAPGTAAGDHALTLRATSAGLTDKTLAVNVKVFSGQAPAVVLSLPADNATEQLTQPQFSWQSQGTGVSYQIDIASDSNFNNIVHTATVSATSYTLASELTGGTTYYWRVRAVTPCGNGIYSSTRSFQTANMICSSPQSSITSNTMDTLNYAGTGVLTDLDLRLVINHTWVGDLDITLTHGATSVTVIDRPGIPGSTFGCGNDNMDIVLNDSAANAAESTCDVSPAMSGELQPNNLLAAFNGANASGDWTLTVNDSYTTSDDGTLVQWCLLPTFSTAVNCSGADAVLNNHTVETGEVLNCDAGNIQVQDVIVRGTLNIQRTGTATFTPDFQVVPNGVLNVTD